MYKIFHSAFLTKLLLLSILSLSVVSVSFGVTKTAEAKTLFGCDFSFQLLTSDGKTVADVNKLDRKVTYTLRVVKTVKTATECAKANNYQFGYYQTEKATTEDQAYLNGKFVTNGSVTAKYPQICITPNQFKSKNTTTSYYDVTISDGGGKDVDIRKYFYVDNNTNLQSNCTVGKRAIDDYVDNAIYFKGTWAGTAPNSPSGNNTDYKPGEVRSPFDALSGGQLNIKNPTGEGDLLDILVKVVNLLLGLLAIIATIMIMYGGTLYIISRGDSSRVSKAKSTLTWAVLGLIISLLAFAIVNIIVSVTA